VRSCDVNVLVYAYDIRHPRKAEYVEWLEDVANGPEDFGLPSQVLSGSFELQPIREYSSGR